MDFEWIVPGSFADIPERNYINLCCVGGDELLSQFRPEIAAEMKISESSIEIYQEDWGWALEFQKEKVSYLLAVNNNSEAEESESIFTAFTQATRKENGLFFDKTVEAVDELKNFSEIISKIAEKKGFGGSKT